MPIFSALKKYAKENKTSFHIPGHKDGAFVQPEFLEFIGHNTFSIDTTEVDGLDDLHQPKEAIKEAQDLWAELAGADNSFILVNGTSSGIIAGLTTIASNGEEIIIPRNSHKSVYTSLVISGAKPIYLQPEINIEDGLLGGIKVDEVKNTFSENPKAKGIYIINPTYYGICSNIEEIIGIAHKNNAIAACDEAHGCHMKFSKKLPLDGISAGADMSFQSTHKMLGSFTQSSILHVKSNNIDLQKLKFNLQMMQTTSPSYLLMASLDAQRALIAKDGEYIFDSLCELSYKTKAIINKIKGFHCLDESIIGTYSIYAFEPLRFVVTARALGITGYELMEIMNKKYGIIPEFSDYYYCIFILGPGSKDSDINKIIYALEEISKDNTNQKKPLEKSIIPPNIPKQALMPREAYFSKKEQIPWEKAKGRIMGEMLIPYPPGIPTICPGEILSDDIYEYLEEMRRSGRHIQGSESEKLKFVNVLK
jgi:lysine decarboxylase